jgi:hypothetical protein
LQPPPAADDRRHGHHRLDSPVERGGHDHHAAAEGNTKDTDSLGIDLVAPLEPADRASEILHLVHREQRAARLTPALAEAAIVDGQRYEACGCQVLDCIDEAFFTDPEAMA